jgi:hypothetical protein
MTKLRIAGIGIYIKNWTAAGLYNADTGDRVPALSAAKAPRSHSAVTHPLADCSCISARHPGGKAHIAHRGGSNKPMPRNLLFKKL